MPATPTPLPAFRPRGRQPDGKIVRRRRLQPARVFLASTGVIGVPLEGQIGGVMERLVADAPRPTPGSIRGQGDHDHRHLSQGATGHARLEATRVTIGGITKGSGMIAPDMATMLSFVFTDAPIAPAVLQSLLQQGSPTLSMP